MEHKSLYSLQRAPDWCWQAAGRLAAIESFDRTIAEHDPGLLAAVTYLRLLAHCNTAEHRLRLAELFPEIERAVEIHSASKYPLRWELESRVLASQDDEAISLTCGVDPAVIATYERLFFNVRDRLSATSWIMRHAIGELTATNVGGIWRHYAFVGGPLVLESLIEHYRSTGQRDYQYLLQANKRNEACSQLHAAIDRAIYARLASPQEVQSAMKLVPQRMAESCQPLTTSDSTTFDLTAMLAESLQAMARRKARRATNQYHQSDTVVG
jgi:hypothetical protein